MQSFLFVPVRAYGDPDRNSYRSLRIAFDYSRVCLNGQIFRGKSPENSAREVSLIRKICQTQSLIFVNLILLQNQSRAREIKIVILDHVMTRAVMPKTHAVAKRVNTAFHRFDHFGERKNWSRSIIASVGPVKQNQRQCSKKYGYANFFLQFFFQIWNILLLFFRNF